MPKRKVIAKEPKAEDDGFPHEAYNALREAKLKNPWQYHDALEKAAHIERIQNRQKMEAQRKEHAAEHPPRDESADAQKALETAISNAERIQKKLDANEAEQSRLLATTHGSNNATYIANVNAELEVLKGLIDQNSRDLREAGKRLKAAEERAQEKETVRESLKSKYVVLSTNARRAIEADVAARRKRKIDQIMRQTETPLLALEQQRIDAREQIIADFGEAELRRLDQIIAAQQR